jgi:type IV secretory pathway VirB2 component (pilin)
MRINQAFLLLILALAGVFLPEVAMAQNSSVAEVLCDVYGWLAGPLGRVIGALAVVTVALMAMFGRIQLPTVLVTMAGLSLIFGSQEIVQALGLTHTCTPSGSAPDILGSPIYTMFACLHGWVGGPVGKSLATLAIIAMGVFAMYGKISYQQALIVCSGIAGMFGAYGVIGELGFSVQGNASISAVAVCSGTNPVGSAYCSLVNWFNGPFGKALATIAIIIIGIGALYGKVSWGLAMLAGIGIALIFGGTTIVAALGGPGSADCAAGGTGKNLFLTVALCNVVNWFNGPIGKGVATLAVIILGLGALFGKVSWTITLVGITGVALIFGATSVVSALGGIGNAPCPNGSMLNARSGNVAAPQAPANNPVLGGSSSSSSGGGITTGVPGTSVNFGNQNQHTFTSPTLTQPGTLTIDPHGSAMIPAGTYFPGQTVNLPNGWVLTMPGNGQNGSVYIPAQPPRPGETITIPGSVLSPNGYNPTGGASSGGSSSSGSSSGGSSSGGSSSGGSSSSGSSSGGSSSSGSSSSGSSSSDSSSSGGSTTGTGGTNSFGLPSGQVHVPIGAPAGTEVRLPESGKPGYVNIPGMGNFAIPEHFSNRPGETWLLLPTMPNGPKIKFPDPDETDPAYKGGYIEFNGQKYPYP